MYYRPLDHNIAQGHIERREMSLHPNESGNIKIFLFSLPILSLEIWSDRLSYKAVRKQHLQVNKQLEDLVVNHRPKPMTAYQIEMEVALMVHYIVLPHL